MQLSDISVWGSVALTLLAAMAAACIVLVDRRLSKRAGRSVLVATLQLVLLALLTWAVAGINHWWACLAWLLFVVAGTTLLLLSRHKREGFRLFVPVALSVLCSTMLLGACLLWVLTPGKPFFTPTLFMAAGGLLVGHQLLAVRQVMQTYLGSLRHTGEHRLYLLSCGATHLESVMPSVRRGLRAAMLPSLHSMTAPMLVEVPTLFCGMLIAGASPLASVAVVWLVLASCFASSVFSSVLFFLIADRWLFSRQGNFLAGSAQDKQRNSAG